MSGKSRFPKFLRKPLLCRLYIEGKCGAKPFLNPFGDPACLICRDFQPYLTPSKHSKKRRGRRKKVG